MKNQISKWYYQFIPSNFHNVFGLAGRLLKSGKSGAYFSIWVTLLGVLMTPLDLILTLFEKKIYKKAPQNNEPLIFVCGPPRSGTTLTAQVLIKSLPVAYFNNLTNIFPRSPITAEKLFGKLFKIDVEKLETKSFYGRTDKIAHINDALYFWDKWTEVNRSEIPKEIKPANQNKMRAFFNAFTNFYQKPLLNKNNSLNTYAHLVAEVLPNARFIFIEREPVFLAQSHYIARSFIHGDLNFPYGIAPQKSRNHEDPVQDICDQLFAFQKIHREQVEKLGEEKVMVIPYEDFCENTSEWVKLIAEKFLNLELKDSDLEGKIPELSVSRRQKLDEQTFQRIQDICRAKEDEDLTFSEV